MKVGIYSHCTIDTIMFGDTKYEAAGGPACYCSLTARNQKFDVNLCTKYGQDFPLIDFLQNNKIEMPICEQIYKVLFEGVSPRKVILELMGRELVDEYPV